MRSGTLVSAAVALALAFFATSCSRTSTSVTAPESAKCQVSATNNGSTPFPSSGGSGTVTISTTRDCTWSVSSDASWVTVSTPNGQGDARVSYTVASNPTTSARSSSLAIASQHIPLSQAAAPCRFNLSRTADSIAAGGGQLTVGVTALSGCGWSAASTVSWITIQSGQSGSGNGTVQLSVAANSDAERVGQVNIAGQVYTVTQAAAPVQLSGLVAAITGKCPTLRFTVQLRIVVTDATTTYTKMKCDDVKNGADVTVTGTTLADGTVHATNVRMN